MSLDGALFTRYNLPLPGPHPATGEPFVAMQLEAQQEVDTYRLLEPSYPAHAVPTAWEYDDDGEEYAVAWRRLTADEWAAVLKEYEAARAEWRRTLGHVHVQGPRTYHARFETASGSHATAVTTEGAGEWIWTGWEVCFGGQPR